MTRLVVLSIAVLASGCCCFGDLSPQQQPRAAVDDPAIDAAARAYLEEHARELLEPAAARQDAGTGSCAAAIVAIGASLAAPVITRGHAGTDLGAEASYDVTACAARIRVVLRRMATGAWIAIGATAMVGSAIVATAGDPSGLRPNDPDVDLDLDELFD